MASITSIVSAERYSTTAAARLVGVHVATIWRWILRGVRGRKLDSVMIGGRRYILKCDLESFLTPGGHADSREQPPELYIGAELVDRQLDATGLGPAGAARKEPGHTHAKPPRRRTSPPSSGRTIDSEETQHVK